MRGVERNREGGSLGLCARDLSLEIKEGGRLRGERLLMEEAVVEGRSQGICLSVLRLCLFILA